MYTWPGQPMGTSRPHAAIKAKHCLFICLGQRAQWADLLIRKDMLRDAQL